MRASLTYLSAALKDTANDKITVAGIIEKLKLWKNSPSVEFVGSSAGPKIEAVSSMLGALLNGRGLPKGVLTDFMKKA
eukprot:108125-Lingulodinium_polyedra.AAC.1